jgi:hypothetical protein
MRRAPGGPGKFTPEQVCAVIALACEDPKDSDLPISQRSQSEVAQQALKRGFVASVVSRNYLLTSWLGSRRQLRDVGHISSLILQVSFISLNCRAPLGKGSGNSETPH